MREQTLPLTDGSDPAERISTLRAAQEVFLAGDGAPPGLRDMVADSWERSVAAGVDPDHGVAPMQLTDGELADHRERHPLATVLPLIRDLLGPVTDDGGHLMAVSDAAGRLLWVEGAAGVRRQAERMNFVAGAAWDERSAGTNAPGTALAVQAPVQIFAAEHFSRIVQPWTCSAAPVRHPGTGELLGAIDLTGGSSLANAASLALVRATARAVAGELTRLWVPPGAQPPATHGAVTLQVLGRDEGLITIGGRQRRLSRRHSEILTVLAHRPDGVSGEQLGLELYGDRGNPITLRAEMSRLRRLLGPEVLTSRPYRLLVPVDTDLLEVTRLVDRGELRTALRRYPGPLLPLSEAPGIAGARRRVEQQLRAAVIASADPGLLTAWTRMPCGQDDLELWETLATVAPYGATRSLARARAAELTAALSVPAALRAVSSPATYLQRCRS